MKLKLSAFLLLSLLYLSCNKTGQLSEVNNSILTVEEAKIFAMDLSSQYWQNADAKTTTLLMLNWSKVENFPNDKGSNTICIPVKENFSSIGYRKLLLGKRKNQLVSIMLVVKPTAVYQQAHGNKVNAKDFDGDLYFYSAKTGKYIKGARMKQGKWVLTLKAVHTDEIYSDEVLLTNAETAKTMGAPAVLIPELMPETDLPDMDFPWPGWEGGGYGEGGYGPTYEPEIGEPYWGTGEGGNIDYEGYDFTTPPFVWTYNGGDNEAFIDSHPTVQPDFQFEPGNKYDSLYPKFTDMVKNLKTFVKENSIVMDALKKYSGFTKTQILNHLSFGQGPIIKVEEMGGKFGYYNKTNGIKTLHIRASYVRGLEQAYYQSTKQGTAFLLAVTILHEYIHLGTTENNISEGVYDFGLGFERDAFNVTVDENNANNVVIKFSKYF